MTSPVEEIRVECPRCGHEYDDWFRPSVNLDLDDFDDDYLRRASTATCPSCGFVVEIGSLFVKDGVWTFPPGRDEEQARAEIAPVEAELRALDPDNPLLRPDAFRGTLWLQAARWEIDLRLRSKAESD